jgi:hypothetical protein
MSCWIYGKKNGGWRRVYSVSLPILLPIIVALIGLLLAFVRSCSGS